MISERDTMSGLAKGLAVIETFSAAKPRQSIAEVSVASGLDRATARRCLLTLASQGYADYDGKFFTLTPRVLRLGTACLAAMPLPQMVQPYLDRLSEELGESTSVAILDADEIVYVARAVHRKVMSIALMPGSRLPAFCTSMGRVLLAALPVEEVRLRLKPDLRAMSLRTVTDPEAVLAIVAQTRAQGWCLNDQEVEIGLRSIAVPVVTAGGVTVAALNFGLPVRGEAAEDVVKRYLPALMALQTELRRLLP